MHIIGQLVRLADIWATESGRSLARLATIVVNRGHFFEALAKGGDCGTETFEKFLHFFRDGANWPDGRIPQNAVVLLDNFASIAVEDAESTGKADDLSSGVGAAA